MNSELLNNNTELAVCDAEPGASDTEISNEKTEALPVLDLEKIQKFIDMYTKTKKLEKEWKDYKEEIEDEYDVLQEELLNTLETLEIPNFTLGGKMIYPHSRPIIKIKELDSDGMLSVVEHFFPNLDDEEKESIMLMPVKEIMIRVMQESEDLDCFIKTSFNTLEMTAFLHSWYDEHGELPSKLDMFVDLDKIYSLRVKNGKKVSSRS